MKKLTIRMDDELQEQLAIIAEVLDTSLNQLVVDVLASYADGQRKDETFQVRATEVVERKLRAIQGFSSTK